MGGSLANSSDSDGIFPVRYLDQNRVQKVREQLTKVDSGGGR